METTCTSLSELARGAQPSTASTPNLVTRREVSGAALGLLTAWQVTTGFSEPALARGRSTQVASWSRYGSRVEAMRSWLVGDLKAMVNGEDYAGLKAATGKKGVVSAYLG